MAEKDIIIMSEKELKRVKIIHEVINEKLTQKEAAEKIDISERQIRRIFRRVEDELAGKQWPLSQYERALKELKIEVKHANSPQAKGRIERLFNTLQDRLIKEMRLENIVSIEEANKFLEKYIPVYNKKFAIEAVRETDFHRNVSKDLNLDEILCIKEERVVRKDFTVNYGKKFYQIMDYITAKKVTIYEGVTGSVFIISNGKRLKYKEIKLAKKEIAKEEAIKAKKEIPFPIKLPIDYSWRRSMDTIFEKERLFVDSAVL